MQKKFITYFHRIRQQLWFRPLISCLLSVGLALLAHQADGTGLDAIVPSIKLASIEGLLDTISASMLVISIFAVGSMISAFSAASTTATPRSFKIVVTDDVSQNALSVFIGSFIFGIVASIALDSNFYGKSGIFILFLFTLSLFAIVILMFLKWVDGISKLGRLEHTISQVEEVASQTLSNFVNHPFLNAMPLTIPIADGDLIRSNKVGYVQNIDLETLQSLAKEGNFKIQINCLPGNYINENFTITTITKNSELNKDDLSEKINKAFQIGSTRMFDADPRFGLISLTEIASRALSPGINDPGTAIQIIGSHERLFFLWNEKMDQKKENTIKYDCIYVPTISMHDFFNDAFRPIARDGAGNIEVMLRLQNVFKSLATINNDEIKKTALESSKNAFKRAELAMNFEPDVELLKKESLFNN